MALPNWFKIHLRCPCRQLVACVPNQVYSSYKRHVKWCFHLSPFRPLKTLSPISLSPCHTPHSDALKMRMAHSGTLPKFCGITTSMMSTQFLDHHLPALRPLLVHLHQFLHVPNLWARLLAPVALLLVVPRVPRGHPHALLTLTMRKPPPPLVNASWGPRILLLLRAKLLEFLSRLPRIPAMMNRMPSRQHRRWSVTLTSRKWGSRTGWTSIQKSTGRLRRWQIPTMP
ncbi:hypothetical protein B0H17DRAFT_1332818, partial [Mycena rosella]